jgi:hypothetical protein
VQQRCKLSCRYCVRVVGSGGPSRGSRDKVNFRLLLGRAGCGCDACSIGNVCDWDCGATIVDTVDDDDDDIVEEVVLGIVMVYVVLLDDRATRGNRAGDNNDGNDIVDNAGPVAVLTVFGLECN